LRLVVDTDVVAAALLGEDRRGREAERLLVGLAEALMPSHWKAEFANVVWKAARAGRLPIDCVEKIMTTASRLPVHSVAVDRLWKGAVARAIATDHPVYDTLFVELAVRQRLPLVSYDRALQKHFPEVVLRPSEIAPRGKQ